MNVNDFKKYCDFLIRKSQAGASYSPDQFNLAMERGYVSAIMEKYGNTKQYQPGRPIPMVAWEQSQRISDELSFLIVNTTMTVDADGKMNTPDGTVKDASNGTPAKYMHLSRLTHKYIKKDRAGNYRVRDVDVDVLRHNQIGSILSSDIVNPTKRHPACAIFDGYFEVYPKDIQKVDITYLKEPTVPVWGYSTVNNRPKYDSATSTDLEAPQSMINDIVFKTLTNLGLSSREIGVVSISEQLQNKGV